MKSRAYSTSKVGRLHPARSVGMRLFLVFFITTMAIVLSLGLVSYSVASRTIEDNALSAHQQTVAQTAEKLDVILLRFEDAVGQIFYNRNIQDALRQGSLSSAGAAERQTQSNRIGTELNLWLSGVKGVQAVYLIPADQSLPISSTGAKDVDFIKEARAEAWFKELAEKPQSKWITKPYVEGAASSGLLRFARSITGESQRTGYIVVSDIKPGEMAGQLNKINLGLGSYTQLLTGKDELIVSSEHQEADTYLRLGGTLLNGLNNTSGSLPTRNEDGESILAVYGTLESTGWRVLGVIPAGNLLKDAGRILNTTYLAIAVAAVVAVLVGIWMVRMVSRPLSRLKDLMVQGAAGNLRVRTEFASRDEIGQLSLSFNSMMERITELVKHTHDMAGEVLGIADELGHASRKTAVSAQDIAAATEEIAGGAGSLALEADRGNELAVRISQQMEQVIAAAHGMDNTARHVGKASQEGVGRLKVLMDRTKLTGEMTHTLVAKVNELKGSASTVIKVLDVMQNIANQTNILSLNAAIEAVRAGEAGQGFKVVAQEIRQLADQSKRSIAEVGEITGHMMNDVNETMTALSAVAPLVTEQMSSVEESGGIFISVQEQMEQLLVHLEAVTLSIEGLGESQQVLTESMGSVSTVAEQSSAASQEVASLSGEQQSVSEHLVSLSASLEKASLQLKDSLAKFSV
ncbi:methyl-accepting chemotaxis protein [Paenibacillus albidus]|uniref:methyl-accepting chemotaxis protein n=1 Tax=Paenibacillus albidus TaxID=2041023 RepID=UPI001E3ECF3B|nr:methyl-accepting chemotaxis protein [Paenibacillus albidus]